LGGAYIICHATGPVDSCEPSASTAQRSPTDVLRSLLAKSGTRTTDVHDIAVVADDISERGPVASGLAALGWPGRPTFGFFERGAASGLDALSHAMLGALTEHRDLSIVLAVGNGKGEPEGAGPGLAVALMVASEHYVRRRRYHVEARVQRVVSAAHSSGRTVDSLYEAAVRLLMNETMNAVEVDDWQIWVPDGGELAQLIDRLGIDAKTVKDCHMGWPHTLSARPAALCAVTDGLAAGLPVDPWTQVTVFPALGGGALAAMVQQTRSSFAAKGEAP
jgi:hypothetical protein